jgi:hypothetical protein
MYLTPANLAYEGAPTAKKISAVSDSRVPHTDLVSLQSTESFDGLDVSPTRVDDPNVLGISSFILTQAEEPPTEQRQRASI